MKGWKEEVCRYADKDGEKRKPRIRYVERSLTLISSSHEHAGVEATPAAPPSLSFIRIIDDH
jgi:hypothetical protein